MNILLKLAGLRYWINKEDSNRCVRWLVNYGYMLLVLVLIGWELVYDTVQSIVNREVKYLSSDFLIMMIVVQLIAGKIIFNDPKLKLQDVETVDTILGVIIGFVSLGFSVAGGICLGRVYVINFTDLYTDETPGNQTLLAILLCMKLWVFHLIYLLNCYGFLKLFTRIKFEMKTFHDQLNDLLLNNSRIDLDTVTKDFARLRGMYKHSVQACSLLFTSLNLLGGLGMAFMVVHWKDPKFFDWFQFVDCLIYLIVQTVYIWSIKQTTNIRDDIQEFPHTEVVIGKYLKRYDTPTGTNDSFIGHLRSQENSVKIDLINLDAQLSTPFEKFRILGFEVEDTVFYQKLFAILAAGRVFIRLALVVGVSK